MSLHTPGPWTLDTDGTKFCIYKPGDRFITSSFAAERARILEEHRQRCAGDYVPSEAQS